MWTSGFYRYEQLCTYRRQEKWIVWWRGLPEGTGGRGYFVRCLVVVIFMGLGGARRWGGGGDFKVVIWRRASHKGRKNFYEEGLDPSRHNGKGLNIYLDYLMIFPSRQHVKWKHLKCKFTFDNDFMMNRPLNLF